MGNSGIREFALRYDILRGGIKYAEAKAAGPAAVSMDMRRKIKRLLAAIWYCRREWTDWGIGCARCLFWTKPNTPWGNLF